MFSFTSKIFPLHDRTIHNRTLDWFNSDRPITYDEINNIYSKDDIKYKFNANGFRCDEFNFDETLRIVFLGCSITEGIGVKQEEIWSYQFLKMVEKKLNCNLHYWNLSLCGCGIDSLLRAYYHYCDLLKPHFLISYLPGYRKEYFNKTNRTIDVYNPQYMHKMPEEFLDENYIKYETNKNFLFLKLLTEKHKTKFYWNTWGNFDYYEEKPNFSSQITVDKKGRDKMHPGSLAHKQFAKSIWAEIGNNINF